MREDKKGISGGVAGKTHDVPEKTIISVVTPTYNRADLLRRCYDSLCNQTDFDFEWIIVDDGSTDNTKSVTEEFCDAHFPITYVKKENGGKHTALNASHPHITGQYVLILDSDDYLVPEAIRKVKEGWTKFKDDNRIGVVVFLKGNDADSPFCMAYDEYTPVDIMRYRRKCLKSNDCCEVIRTELFCKYSFPVFDGERFISEGALWNRVSFTHQCVYINQVIYIADYLSGGLTNAGKPLRIRNPRGGMYTANLNMNRKNFMVRRIKSGLLYSCYGFFAGWNIPKMIKHNDSKLLAVACVLPGWMLYLYWKRKYL